MNYVLKIFSSALILTLAGSSVGCGAWTATSDIKGGQSVEKKEVIQTVTPPAIKEKQVEKTINQYPNYLDEQTDKELQKEFKKPAPDVSRLYKILEDRKKNSKIVVTNEVTKETYFEPKILSNKVSTSSTTQASQQTTGSNDNNFNVGEDGSISSSVKAKIIQSIFKQQTALALLFLGFAAYFWYFGNEAFSVVSIACVVLAYLYPAILIWIAIALVGAAAWGHRKNIKQLVVGIESIKSDDPATKTADNTTLAAHQGTGLQNLVDNLRK